MIGIQHLELTRRGAMIELFEDLPFYRSHLQIYHSFGPSELPFILLLITQIY